MPDVRAREARELERQKAWRDQASKALTLKAEEGTGPVNVDELEAAEEARIALWSPRRATSAAATTPHRAGRAR